MSQHGNCSVCGIGDTLQGVCNNPDCLTNREKDDNEQYLNLLTAKLFNERQRRVAEYADKAFKEDNGTFTIRLKIPTGNKISNPLGGEDLEEYKENEYETKTYHFHRVSANDWNLYLSKNAELTTERMKAERNDPNTDPEKIRDLNARIYEFLALKYLGIKHDEYIRAEWDDIRIAVDACNHMTEWASKEIEVTEAGKVKMTTIKKPEKSKTRVVSGVEKIRPTEYSDFEPKQAYSSDSSSSNKDYGTDYDG